jgi:hypothetical protein
MSPLESYGLRGTFQTGDRVNCGEHIGTIRSDRINYFTASTAVNTFADTSSGNGI